MRISNGVNCWPTNPTSLGGPFEARMLVDIALVVENSLRYDYVGFNGGVWIVGLRQVGP